MNILEMRRRTLGKGVYKETAEGSAIVARSLARMRPGLKIMGKSTQKTTTGAQLFDFASIAPETLETNGVTVTNNKDGSFTVTGTPTKESVYIFTFHYFLNEPIKDGEYFASDDLTARIFKKDGTIEYANGGFTFNSETDSGVGLYWQRSKDTYKDGETVWPMLNAGSTAIPWEPYTGGKPSPSPDYPQEIEIAGEGSRQLFDAIQIQNGFVNGANTGESLSISTSQTLPDAQFVKIPVEGIERISYDLTDCVNTNIDQDITGLRIRYFDKTGIAVKPSEPVSLKSIKETSGASDIYILALFGFTENASSKAMVNAGSTFFPWEPYRKGNVEVSVYGGNLLDVNMFESSSVVSVSIDDNTLTLKNISGKEITSIVPQRVPVELIPGVVYYFAGDVITNEGLLNIDVINSENVREKIYNNGSSFVAEKGMRYEVKAYMNKEGSTIPAGAEKVYKNVRLVAINRYTPWEPYKKPQTLTVQTPNGLPGIPVGSGGNYTDEDGQQWVCDEIDFRRGKYVQRIAHYVFDGSKDEGWNIIVSSSSGIKLPYAYIYVQRGVSQYNTKLLCNVGKYSTWNFDGTCFINEYERYFFYHPSIESILNQGIEAWRAWLEKNNIELLYILENPIETDLTPEQMQQYESIHTNRPTTTVVNDAGCHMSLTYKTKKSLEVT